MHKSRQESRKILLLAQRTNGVQHGLEGVLSTISANQQIECFVATIAGGVVFEVLTRVEIQANATLGAHSRLSTLFQSIKYKKKRSLQIYQTKYYGNAE